MIRARAQTTASDIEMLTEPIDEALLQKLVDRIRSQIPATAAILLFGSRAHGDAVPWSDVDLLVITETHRDPLAVAGDVYIALQPRNFALDVLVMTPGDVQRHVAAQDPFVKEILRRGRVLYGRLP